MAGTRCDEVCREMSVDEVCKEMSVSPSHCTKMSEYPLLIAQRCQYPFCIASLLLNASLLRNAALSNLPVVLIQRINQWSYSVGSKDPSVVFFISGLIHHKVESVSC